MQKIIKSVGLYILGVLSTVLLSAASNDWDIAAMVKQALNPEAAIMQAVDTFKDAPAAKVVEALPESSPSEAVKLKQAAEVVQTDSK